MNIETNYSLKSLNTFNLDVKAKQYVKLQSIQELSKLIHSGILKQSAYFVLGGGSNVLFTKDFEGIIVQADFKGIDIIKENEESIVLSIGAGEVWEALVEYTVKQNWGGIENLALIPGHVGAAPIQNIGAYGTELKDVFVSLNAIHLETGKLKNFTKEDCHFDYRYSIFKGDLKGKYLVADLQLRLSKNPKANLSYRAIQKEFEGEDPEQVSIQEVYDKVVQIRESKLPDPEKIGNAGSSFKNPVVPHAKLEELILEYPDLVHFPHKPNQVKLAAAWLIDQCGWKGKQIGDAGVHKNQALVLVNYGNAKGEEVLNLAEKIKKSVFDKFGVNLEFEINII